MSGVAFLCPFARMTPHSRQRGHHGTDRSRPRPARRDLSNVDLSRASGAAGGSPVLRGYLASPEGEGPFPAVLMVHEAFGLDDITVRHANRMAAAGYLTLAVDLYSDGGA